jgi:hypothetical protein
MGRDEDGKSREIERYEYSGREEKRERSTLEKEALSSAALLLGLRYQY